MARSRDIKDEDGLPAEPLTPPDCDLRDFRFMPLDVVRLRDSDLAALEEPAACWAAVLLWCAAWHQLPAASLPDDDRVLSQLAGFGRVVKEWLRVRAGALRGWVKCSDGRLYHPVVAEKALEAWAGRHKQRYKTECARIKKHIQRHGTAIPIPTLEQFLSQDYVDPTRGDTPMLSQGTSSSRPANVPREITSKGEGEGEGEGYKNKSYSSGVGSAKVVGAVDNSDSPPLSADESWEHLMQLEAKLGREPRLSASGRDALHRIADLKVCLPQLCEAHARACVRREDNGDQSPVNPGFLEAFVKEVLAEGRGDGAPLAVGWDETTAGVQAKAVQLGLQQGADEHPIRFRLRVIRQSRDQRLIESELSKAERMNPSEFERVRRFMHDVASSQVMPA